MSEKTEAPTEQRLRDARTRGQVTKSIEITTGVQLLTILLYFSCQGWAFQEMLQALIEQALRLVNQDFNAALDMWLHLCIQWSLQCVGNLGILLLMMTILSMLAQTGFLFTPAALAFSLEKISLMANIKRLVSTRTLFELLKACLKLLILSASFYYLLKQYVPSFQFLPLCDITIALPLVSRLAFWMWSTLVLAHVLFGLSDYSLQRFMLMRQLRMTKEEVKQEWKNNEGSPEIKAKRRELHQEVQSGSLSARIKKSSVLIRNPTHIAVCLYYHPEHAPIPVLLEKGAGQKAELMVDIAEAEQIPIVQQRYLARCLMRDVAIGSAIPSHLFDAVAQVLQMILSSLPTPRFEK